VARAVARCGGGRWEVELCSYGPTAARETLEPGLARRVLRSDNSPDRAADWLSWELIDVLDGADLAHVYGPFTHGGGLTLALGVERHLPMCVTDYPYDSLSLGRELGAAELAGAVIAHSAGAARRVLTARPVEVIRIGIDTDFFRPPSPSAPRGGVLLMVGAGAQDGIDALGLGHIDVTSSGRPAEDGSGLRGVHPSGASIVEPQTTELELRRSYQRALVTIAQAPLVESAPLPPEWLALTMLESMACGTPVIAPVGMGADEYFENGRTGWLVHDLSELRACVVRLLDQPEIAAEAGRAGREWVEQHWQLETAGRQLLDVYEGLLR
jgi:glycosyltransferase involved in cell wall biosynthesis